MEYVIYVAVGTLFLIWVVYCIQKRRLSRGGFEVKTFNPVGGYDPASDPFYCIHLKDGSSRSGYITKDLSDRSK